MEKKTYSATHNRYNAKAYDRISLMVKKGEREVLQAHAAERGESVNGFINRAIRAQIERDNMK